MIANRPKAVFFRGPSKGRLDGRLAKTLLAAQVFLRFLKVSQHPLCMNHAIGIALLILLARRLPRSPTYI
jgi:hypothetical protein